MSRARKITVVALVAGILGLAWKGRGWILGWWAMSHAND
jgi:hypothetical protein